MDFDLRRRPGFRNPPMAPPVPFPGAWETQGTSSWYYRARRNFNFRRPPDHWRSGPPMNPPDDSAAKSHLQHVERSINVSVPWHEKHPCTDTSVEEGAAHAGGSGVITGQHSAYRAQHAVEEGNQHPSGDALSRDEEHLKTDQKYSEDEQAQMTSSVDGDGPELLGISILNAVEGGNQHPSGDALSRDEEHLKTDQKYSEDEQAQMTSSVDGDGPELLGISILNAVEGGNQHPSGDTLSRDEEHLKTDQKYSEDEQAQMASSVDGDGPELLGISILNALEEVAGGGGEWSVGVQESTSARGDENGEEHEAELDMHPTLDVANPPSTQTEQPSGEEFPHTEEVLSESVEEEEEFEDVGLVMSPEWAEHLRNSPSVQRYLQRVASKQAHTGNDTRGAEGKQSGGDDPSRSEKQSGGAGNGGGAGASRKKGKGKGKGKKKGGGKKDTTVQKVAKDEVSSAEKDMELQLAKIKAHALLYAHQQQHRQLEDIIEES